MPFILLGKEIQMFKGDWNNLFSLTTQEELLQHEDRYNFVLL